MNSILCLHLNCNSYMLYNFHNNIINHSIIVKGHAIL